MVTLIANGLDEGDYYWDEDAANWFPSEEIG